MKRWSLEGVPLEIRDSGVHGLGAFALGRIRAGDPVVHATGRIVVLPENATLPDSFWALEAGPGVWLEADPDSGDPDNYMNHSCEPNVGFQRGTLTFYALRDIEPGEELFWHYSTGMNEPGWSVPCHCGAPTCRSLLQSFRDLPPEEQARLRPIALDYLRR
jgi:SET domain-containing protein